MTYIYMHMHTCVIAMKAMLSAVIYFDPIPPTIGEDQQIPSTKIMILRVVLFSLYVADFISAHSTLLHCDMFHQQGDECLIFTTRD